MNKSVKCRKKMIWRMLMIASVCLCICMSISAVAFAAGSEYMRVQPYTTAYYEPVEEEFYKIGQFAYEGDVLVKEQLNDSWAKIAYYYDATMYEELGFAKAESTALKERIVYVRKEDLTPVQNKETDIRNVLLTEEEIQALNDQKGVFEPLLLTETGYKPTVTGADDVRFTIRTKTTGNEADSRDILLAQKQEPYENNNRFLYLPEIRVGGELRYPIDGKSYNFLTAENIRYYPNNDLIQQPGVLSGLRFILENSPPYKVYTSNTSDYMNASRTSASIAIRAYLAKTLYGEDTFTIDSLEAGSSDFSTGYFGYATWLYENAMERYRNNTEAESSYISCNIEQEPILIGSIYQTSVRIITNAETGWKILKSSLPKSVIRIENANETRNEYYGECGSTVIRIMTDANSTEEITEIPVLYNTDEYIIQIFEPDQPTLPILVSLSPQNTDKAPRQINIQYPTPPTVTFSIKNAKDKQPVGNVTIRIANVTGEEAEIKTNADGIATYKCEAGAYTYELTDLPALYDAEKTGSVVVNEDASVEIVCTEKSLNATIHFVNAFTNETIEKPCLLEIYKESEDGNKELYTTGTAENGILEIKDIPRGKYVIHQVSDIKGYELSPDAEFFVDVDNVEPNFPCNPVSGTLVITAKEKGKNISTPGLTVKIFQDAEELIRVTTDETGQAVLNKIPSGDYTMAIVGLPQGYTLPQNQADIIKFTIRYQQKRGVDIGLIKRNLQISVYPREETDTEENLDNPPVTTENGNLNGLVYELIADEGNPYYEPGTVVETFEPTGSKNCSSTISVSNIGKYIIREKTPGDGYMPAEDVKIMVTESVNHAKVRIDKKHFSGSVKIVSLDPEENPTASRFMIYPDAFSSYDEAPSEKRFTAETNENGETLQHLPVGAWIIEREAAEGEGSPARTLLRISADDAEEKTVKFVGNDAPTDIFVRVQNRAGEEIIISAQYELYKDNEKIRDYTAEKSFTLEEPLYAGEYTIRQIPVSTVYEAPEDVRFTVSADQYYQEVVITDIPRDKNLALSAVTPVYTYNAEKDIVEETLRFIGNVQLSYTENENSETQPVTVVSSEDGVIITPPLPLRTYSVYAEGIPEGYTSEENPRIINTENETTNTVQAAIHLKPNPSVITLQLYNPSHEDKNGAIYGLFAYGANQTAKEGEEARKTLILTKAEAFNDQVMFVQSLPAGSYCLAPVYEDGTININYATEFEIEAPEQNITLREKQNPYHSFTVRVLSEDTHTALSEAYIRIENADSASVWEGYPENGEININLKEGEYKVIPLLAPEGYAVPDAKTVTIENTENSEAAAEILFAENIVKVLETDKNGNPIQGAEIELRGNVTNYSNRAITDADGIAEFRHVGFDRYTVTESFPAPGNMEAIDQYTINVDGTYRNDTTGIPKFTAEINRLQFKVLTMFGDPYPNAELVLLDSQENSLQSTITDENGMGFFTSVAYGTYKVKMQEIDGDYLRSETEYSIVVSKQTPEVFNEIRTFVCVPRKVRLSLVDNTGAGVAGAEFTLYEKATAIAAEVQRTDANGECTFRNIGYGEYLIWETGVPEGTIHAEEQEIVIDGSWTGYKKSIFTTAPDYYDFVSMDNRGNILAGTAYTITNMETAESFTVKANEKGKVHVSGLVFGQYDIRETEVPEGYTLSGETIHLSIGEDYRPSETDYIFITRKKDS